MSPPQLTDESSASATAYLALDLSFQLGGAFGPLVRTVGFGELGLDPTRNPWWSMDVGIGQEAGTRLSFLGIDVNWTFPAWEQRWTILDSNATTKSQGPGGTRTAGETVRWANAYTGNLGGGVFNEVEVVATRDGGGVVWGNIDRQDSFMIRLDEFGNVLWAVDDPATDRTAPVSLVELPDGSLLVAGNHDPGEVFLARFGDNGIVLEQWTGNCSPACEIEDMALGEDELGNPIAAIVGFQTMGSQNKDLFVMTFDADPNFTSWDLLAANRHELYDPGAQRNNDWPHAIASLAGGGFVAVGETDADVGVDRDEKNYLFFTVDSRAEIGWAMAIASLTPPKLHDVVQGLDGLIYATGEAGRGVQDTYPETTVVRVRPDGTDLRQVLIAQEDAAWLQMHSQVPDNSPPTPGGDNPSDYASSIVATESGPMIVGGTSDNVDEAAWAIQLDHSLGVQWLSVFDGPMPDFFQGAAEAEDGFLVVGESSSWLPVGSGGDSALTVHKIPREGVLRYDPSSGGISRYLQPRVETASDRDFWADDGAGGLTRTATIDLTAQPLTVTPGGLIVDFVPAVFTGTPIATPEYPAPTDVIFSDDFEFGDTSSWSTAVP
jgi:hypothetical protein